MGRPPDDDRADRIRQARQVLAGGDVTPPDDPIGFGDRFVLGGSGEFRYFVGLAVLVVLSALAWAIAGMGLATPFLVVLAVALLAAWLLL